MSPRFQDAVVRSSLTRRVARRRARGLFDLMAGFAYSQTLFACVRIGLFDRLRSGPLSRDEIARAVDLPPDATARLLEAAAALDLVEPVGEGRWMLGATGAALLGNAGLVEMVSHHQLLYADMADPVALLAQGRGALAEFWNYRSADGDRAAAYSRLMAASQPLVARQVIDAYPFRRHRRLLDIGGGEGAFVQAVLERAPGLRATVLDLPPVAERARRRFAETGLTDRAEAIGGDFRHGPLPPDHDVITMVRVLHDHDDDTVARLLAAARAALAPGGRVVIAEPMAGTAGAEPVGAAYFGWYLWAMGSGQPRRAGEIESLARAAGFSRVRERRTAIPLSCRIIVLCP